MKDSDCVPFLQWALPRLRLHWPGFRKVRKQVCKRLSRRLQTLRLPHIRAYAAFLERHPGEWRVLSQMCWITISRFYRDKGVFQVLEREVLPYLARLTLDREEQTIRCWCAGCASGEEPYALALIGYFRLRLRFPTLDLNILATDTHAQVLYRAQTACYPATSLKELPPSWRARAFVRHDDRYCLRAEFQRHVALMRHDVTTQPPTGPFALVLCRNLAFTYFDAQLQRQVLQRLHDSLIAGGVLVIGAHERLPAGAAGWVAWASGPGIFKKR